MGTIKEERLRKDRNEMSTAEELRKSKKNCVIWALSKLTGVYEHNLNMSSVTL